MMVIQLDKVDWGKEGFGDPARERVREREREGEG